MRILNLKSGLFLRRRNSDSRFSARPQPEEAQKWSESFAALMASKCNFLSTLIRVFNFTFLTTYYLFNTTCKILIFQIFFVCFSKDGSALYRAFLLREFSNENLDFWLAVEEYKKSKSQKMAAKAQQIYNDFVAVKATKQVR